MALLERSDDELPTYFTYCDPKIEFQAFSLTTKICPSCPQIDPKRLTEARKVALSVRKCSPGVSDMFLDFATRFRLKQHLFELLNALNRLVKTTFLTCTKAL